ncbi:MAG: hypothetical protein ACLUIQ_11605 [Dialister invisus]
MTTGTGALRQPERGTGRHIRWTSPCRCWRRWSAIRTGRLSRRPLATITRVSLGKPGSWAMSALWMNLA